MLHYYATFLGPNHSVSVANACHSNYVKMVSHISKYFWLKTTREKNYRLQSIRIHL